MKNLLKILLVLAFSTSAFAGSMPASIPQDPTTVSVTMIQNLSDADQKAWLNSLTADQYAAITDVDVKAWIMNTANSTQKATLGISQ